MLAGLFTRMLATMLASLLSSMLFGQTGRLKSAERRT